MNPIHLVLLAFAFVCECIAALNLVSGENRVRVIAGGLAFFFASVVW